MTANRRNESGFVLVVVIFFVALLFIMVSTFVRRATLDSVIVRNRDNVARAEALARGGVELAKALLLQDRILELEGGEFETGQEYWAQLRGIEWPMDDGGTLSLQIEDSGTRLNLNALLDENGEAQGEAEPFLIDFFQKVIDEMPGRPEDKLYDREELARSLLDWIDADEGGDEDDYYQRQDPPYTPPNHPLLSVDELSLIEGFDAPLVKALRPYVTVYPFVGGTGINPNTAPSWVLASVFVGSEGDRRLAFEDDDFVEDLVEERDKLREAGGFLCENTADGPDCTAASELGLESSFPPLGFQSHVFSVRSTGRYAGLQRTVETIIDRTDAENLLILAWRVR